MKCADPQRWALVLAGGDGKRLQGLTREITGAPIPKQYCRIANGRSLLQAALGRTEGFTTVARTVVIIKRDHLPLASTQLGAVPGPNVIVQPENRDTGPGLLLSLLHVRRRDPAALLAVLPSDHYVGDEAAFLAHVDRAAEIVRRLPDKIALVGIPPDRVEPGYGYVLPALPLAGATSAPAFHVAAFYEKPAADVAARLLTLGAMWNSFVMVFRVSRMLELLQRHLPDRVVHFDGVVDDAAALERVYHDLPSWNFCRDFLHHVPEHLVVVRADDTGWSDWGTPQAVMRTLAALGDGMVRRAHPPAAAQDEEARSRAVPGAGPHPLAVTTAAT
jgi:mannose-1-phosphate guanylyltransferase